MAARFPDHDGLGGLGARAEKPTCYCGSKMRLRESQYGPFWSCCSYPECDGKVGAHPDGSPLGTPVDKVTRGLRIDAHLVFDQLWKSGAMTRSEAYRWMRETLKLSKAEAHIARMNRDQCVALIVAVGRITP